MQLPNQVLSDEAVHEAARRLRETLRASVPAATGQQLTDMDIVLAWIMRQTELPESYRQPGTATPLHRG